MALLNCGGLTLVSKKFFNWAKKLMKLIRKSYTYDDVSRDPVNSFDEAKSVVLNDRSNRELFKALCVKNSSGSPNVIERVFTVVVRKAVHARFAVVFRRWKEANVKKNGQLALRTKLKAQSSAGSKAGTKATPGKCR
ncbi:hypothetical protein ACHAWF_014997 [Thalassiosira exigua]